MHIALWDNVHMTTNLEIDENLIKVAIACCT